MDCGKEKEVKAKVLQYQTEGTPACAESNGRVAVRLHLWNRKSWQLIRRPGLGILCPYDSFYLVPLLTAPCVGGSDLYPDVQ